MSDLPHEECFICNEHTGRAGKGDDSLYDQHDYGPYCEECWGEERSYSGEIDKLRAHLDAIREPSAEMVEAVASRLDEPLSKTRMSLRILKAIVETWNG